MGLSESGDPEAIYLGDDMFLPSSAQQPDVRNCVFLQPFEDNQDVFYTFKPFVMEYYHQRVILLLGFLFPLPHVDLFLVTSYRRRD